jgi:glycosyltransferase involved in cell wall biosynthesis
VSEPSFTVVIPAYNAPRTIGSAIGSVLGQTRSDLEVVVVDDGSTDSTAEAVERLAVRDQRVRLLRQRNQGVATARNAGIEAARGVLVSFLDNDDLWLPRYLELMGAALDADPLAGFAYTDGWTLDDASRRIFVESTMSTADPPERPPDDAGELLRSLLRRNYVLSSATVRRSILAEVGGFDPSLTGVDEYDLWLRIAAAGHRAARVPGRLVIQRERGDSQSKDEVMMFRALERLLVRYAEDDRWPEPARIAAAEQLRRWRAELAALEGAGGIAGRTVLARRALGRVRRRLGAGPATFATPPPDVAAAFPDLDAV